MNHDYSSALPLMDVVVRAQEGDPIAWNDLVRRFHPLVMKHVRHIGYDPMDAYQDLQFWLIGAIKHYRIRDMSSSHVRKVARR